MEVTSEKEAPSKSSFVLQKGFVAMNDVLDGKVKLGSFVKVAGLVRDTQVPRESRGTDHKMTIKLIDTSIDTNGSMLTIHVFAPRDEIREVSLGEVVVVHDAKVQQHNGMYSLITNRVTLLFLYPTDQVAPRPLKKLPIPRDGGINEKNSSMVRLKRQLMGVYGMYAAQLYHAVDKSGFPDMVSFRHKVEESRNFHKKESTLGALVAGYTDAPKFYDLVVQVVKKSFHAESGLGDYAYETLWVTDYSENAGFRDIPDPSGRCSTGADGPGQPGDEMGYLNNYRGRNSTTPNKFADWPGPYGKLSMKVACTEPHATYIREHIKPGDWVRLRNVRVNLGNHSLCLEGYLTADVAIGNPVRVERIETRDAQLADLPELCVEALRRKKVYLKQNKKRKAAAMTTDGEGSAQSKAKNAKQRRREMRASSGGGGAAVGAAGGNGSDGGRQQAKPKPKKKTVAVNRNVVTEHPQGQDITPLARMLEQERLDLLDGQGKEELVLPFVNRNYRVQVRVVDFLPERLEDFAVCRRWSDTDALDDDDAGSAADASSAPKEGSDDDDDDDDDNDDDDDDNDNDDDGTLNRFRQGKQGETRWEWRFALLLEDATEPLEADPATPPRRVWALVDDKSAQSLTDLDACDLRRDSDTLKRLKTKMFNLWGELGEQKEKARKAARAARETAAHQAAAAKKAEDARKAREAAEARRQRELQRKKEEERQRKAAAQTMRHYPAPAPEDSDDDDDDDGPGASSKGGKEGENVAMADAPPPVQPPPPPPPPAAPVAIRQTPFVCCLAQYGVRVPAAGAGKKKSKTWVRKFALHSTRIWDASGG